MPFSRTSFGNISRCVLVKYDEDAERKITLVSGDAQLATDCAVLTGDLVAGTRSLDLTTPLGCCCCCAARVKPNAVNTMSSISLLSCWVARSCDDAVGFWCCWILVTLSSSSDFRCDCRRDFQLEKFWKKNTEQSSRQRCRCIRHRVTVASVNINFYCKKTKWQLFTVRRISCRNAVCLCVRSSVTRYQNLLPVARWCSG